MKGTLNEYTVDELQEAYWKAKEELRVERFKATTSKPENTKKIREIKKNIARILTLQQEYKLGIRK